jgi:hypothetical protein
MSTEVNDGGTRQIYGLMAQILQEVESIGKGRNNLQQGYKFRGIDDVYNMVHPLMSKHQVFCVPRMLAQDTSERITANGTTLRFVQLSMAYDFFAPDGSHVTAEVMGEAMDAGDKASNKAMSAAHKYALLQTFCIPTGDVPDADYTTHEDIQPRSTSGGASTNGTGEQPKFEQRQCPDCNGPMWDNRATKKGKQPDFKCKNRSCNKAVWLDNEPRTEGYSDDQVLRDQLFVQAEKLMVKMEPEARKDALGRLLMLSTALMSEKVNELAENARKKQSNAALESDRDKMIREIQRDAKPEMITAYLQENFGAESFDNLADEEIRQSHEDLVLPF